MNPRVIKEEGYKHLDRVIDIVSDGRGRANEVCQTWHLLYH